MQQTCGTSWGRRATPPGRVTRRRCGGCCCAPLSWWTRATRGPGLAWGPVGIRQRGVGRAPHPHALGRSIGATNPHLIASRSGDQQRVCAADCTLANWRPAAWQAASASAHETASLMSVYGGGGDGDGDGGGDGEGGVIVVPLATIAEITRYAVLGAARVVGLAWGPVGIRQRGVGRAPHPRALGRSIGAANPHLIASRSGDQQRVLRCGLHARQLEARRLAGGVGIGPRNGVAHERVGARGRGRRRRRRRQRRLRAERATTPLIDVGTFPVDCGRAPAVAPVAGGLGACGLVTACPSPPPSPSPPPPSPSPPLPSPPPPSPSPLPPPSSPPCVDTTKCKNCLGGKAGCWDGPPKAGKLGMGHRQGRRESTLWPRPRDRAVHFSGWLVVFYIRTFILYELSTQHKAPNPSLNLVGPIPAGIGDPRPPFTCTQVCSTASPGLPDVSEEGVKKRVNGQRNNRTRAALPDKCQSTCGSRYGSELTSDEALRR
eukprot:scaffold23827_cov63-Phaeocystis_antarctica.AAC.2